MSEPEESPAPALSRRDVMWLLAITIGYIAFRLPFVLYQPGGQDEQLFSVPGYTVATEGIPRIPYYPARDPKCFFYRTDECEFALPPGLFYLQAPFFWLLPVGYPTSRLPCLIAGAIAIWQVYELGRRAFGGSAGLWAAGMYATSRVLFFAATFARPDEPCAAFCLGAILAVWNYTDAGDLKRLVLAGVLLGLGLLCHPFAIVYCLVCGVWVLLVRGSAAKRIGHATVLTATTLATLAVWTPLILKFPEPFQKQFFNNVLNPAGPGLMRRLLWPVPYVRHQIHLLWEQAGVWQMAVMGVGLVGVTLLIFTKSSSKASRRMVAVIWGVVYFHTACQGLHPTKGYWCSTGALLLIAAGAVVSQFLDRFRPLGGAVVLAAGLGIGALFLPQSGIRLWWALVSPGSGSRYNGPAFVRELITSLPEEGRYVVEPAFVFDFWLAGREVIVRVEPRDYLIDRFEYDWLVVDRDGLDKSIPEKLGGELVRSMGPKGDPLACYAEIYRPARSAAPTEPPAP